MFGLKKSRTFIFRDVFGNVETDGWEVIGTVNEEDCVRYIVCGNIIIVIIITIIVIHIITIFMTVISCFQEDSFRRVGAV